MLDPATARLCVWRLPLEAAFRLFSKLGSLGGSIRERFSRTGRARPALARPAFSRWLLENDRLRERWPCQWLNVLYFPFSETSPCRCCDGVRLSTDRGSLPRFFYSFFLFFARAREDRPQSLYPCGFAAFLALVLFSLFPSLFSLFPRLSPFFRVLSTISPVWCLG